MGIKPTQVRLSGEAKARIRALVGDSGMAKFIREAVEAELVRREREAGRREGRPGKKAAPPVSQGG